MEINANFILKINKLLIKFGCTSIIRSDWQLWSALTPLPPVPLFYLSVSTFGLVH